MNAGFLNDNEYRGFPFLKGTTAKPIDGPVSLNNLSDRTLVDCGFIIAGNVAFDVTEDSIFLKRVRRVGSVFYFLFHSDCPALIDVEIEFAFAIDADKYSSNLSDSGVGGVSLSGSESDSDGTYDCVEPILSGYLTVGSLSWLRNQLSSDGTIEEGSTRTDVEPSLIQDLTKSFVTTINIGNQDRTRVSAPEGCDPVTWPFETDIVLVNETCIIGDVVFKEGFNTTIRQTQEANSLTFSAIAGSGRGQPCEEFALTSTEAPPVGSNFMGGGLSCFEVLRSINGRSGPIVNIFGGTGVGIVPDADNNTVQIIVDRRGMAICYESISEVYEEV